ncbi:MAG TPA: beta-ketoacyl synthase N-terminal-like domain-containing protein [Stellaceae bacterium]|nr:beta-ketoacyl synthase N-terminal-like domain-containing protein [Stellaceae bacterium]
MTTTFPRPAVSAVGAVSALGFDWPTTWTGLLAGASPRTSYRDLDRRYDIDVLVAAVPGLNRDISQDGGGAAVRLANMALDQVRTPAEPVRIYGGSNHGETDLLLTLLLAEVGTGSREQWRAVLFDPVPRACGGSVDWTYGACGSGLLALAAAVQDSAGSLGEIIVLAADALSAIEVIGFRRIGAVAQHGCRPFHDTRDGLLIGEGAVALRLAASAADSAAIRLLGFGLSCDAGHPTDPDPDGRWLGKALDDALRRAELIPSDIKAIVCHGTGTQKNDAIEAAIITERWGARGVPITSVKGGLGHTMGAAGLFNVLVAVEACRTGKLPPTTTDGSATLDRVDVVCGRPRDIEPGGAILVLASGFGGNNAACIVGARQ